ncbi:MAG: ATP-binding protein [Defluviitaleaceae bacterium]|nr:ATP-binding protein [Defluviitaleaceae bacterium]MCL2240402.1 ATP-binding protein [Defluviitaleaceae bacterium]
MSVPPRIANLLINALRSGVVPRVGLEHITVGRAQEIGAILHDIDMIEAGGASFRFIVGKYGSGKSFLMQTIRNYAAARGFVVCDADLSPERRLVGTKGSTQNQGLATYRELMRHLSTKAKPDGGALPLILEKWISGIMTAVKTQPAPPSGFDAAVERQIFAVMDELEGMVNGFAFAQAVSAYYRAYRDGDDTKKSQVLKWFRGEYNGLREARADLGINLYVNDENWYDFMKIFAIFLVKAGYKGLLVLIDELVNLYKLPNAITRAANYEKILTLFNDTLQGKAKHIGFLMGGTPQCMEDKYRGIFSYEALRSRLAEGHFASADVKDLTAPIIRLAMLTQEEMYVLVEKLRDIHASLYAYTSPLTHEDLLYFLTVEYNRVGAATHITPREIIRDFIELANILHQNPQLDAKQVLGSNSFELAKGGLSDEDVHSEFKEFEI